MIPKNIKAQHERCSDCKNVIYEMLRQIYGGNSVKNKHKINVPAKIEEYSNKPYYKDLKKILATLENFRGKRNFVSRNTLPHCDVYVSNPSFVVELDESQHFTRPRKLALSKYPKNLKLGFNRQEWVYTCKKLNRKDNDPTYKRKDRDERRAWFDTLRDFLPLINGYKPTVRIRMGNFDWCSLKPNKKSDVEKFKKMVKKLPKI